MKKLVFGHGDSWQAGEGLEKELKKVYKDLVNTEIIETSKYYKWDRFAGNLPKELNRMYLNLVDILKPLTKRLKNFRQASRNCINTYKYRYNVKDELQINDNNGEPFISEKTGESIKFPVLEIKMLFMLSEEELFYKLPFQSSRFIQENFKDAWLHWWSDTFEKKYWVQLFDLEKTEIEWFRDGLKIYMSM